MTLLYTTQRLLQKAPRHLTLKRISTESEVPYEWLKHFHADRINDPGIRRVQALHDYLVNMPAAKPVRWAWSEVERRILPEAPGVYEILDATGAHLYVGETNSVSRRIGEHARTQAVTDAQPECVEFTEISDIDARLWLETLRIRVYNPSLNTKGKGGYTSAGRTIYNKGRRDTK